MEVFYYKVEGGNFGDDMNEWFWSSVFPEHSSLSPDTTIFGIGSILWKGNFDAFPKVLVLGSGMRFGITGHVPESATIGWVRGPRTGKLLNLDSGQAITDPACMLSTFAEFSGVPNSGETLLIPHVGTTKLDLDWEKIARNANTTYLSPAGEAKEVIRRIAGAKLVVTESLHGAIVADAFRVPWIPIAISPTFTSYKWLDWTDSMNMSVEFAPCLSVAKRIYALQKKVTSFAKGRGPKPGGAQVAGAVEYDLSGGEKDVAKRIFATFAAPIEGMISSDVKAALKRSPYLSEDAVLRSRQRSIARRVEEIRDIYIN